MRTALFSVAAALLLSRCTGCSEQCSGDNQGAETCPCSSDQDCTTRLGAVLLCVEGACAVADPPEAETELARCNADGSCVEGQGCGVDDLCLPAPRCQRVDVDLTFRLEGDTSGPVAASRDDCQHEWSAAVAGGEAFTATLTIDLAGNIEATGCTSGHWFAGDRVGELLCDGVTWALAPSDVRACVGAGCAPACVLVGDSERVRVCP